MEQKEGGIESLAFIDITMAGTNCRRSLTECGNNRTQQNHGRTRIDNSRPERRCGFHRTRHQTTTGIGPMRIARMVVAGHRRTLNTAEGTHFGHHPDEKTQRQHYAYHQCFAYDH